MTIQKVKITTEYITLGQFLKFAGLIGYGSDAKLFLNEHLITVNGESENRRGRKLYPQDKIVINKMDYLLVHE